MKGHRITRSTGERLATDLRTRRFAFTPEKVSRPGQPFVGSVRHFKTPGGGLPGFNSGTNTLGSALCREWTKEGAVLSDSGEDYTVFNQYGALPANVFVIVGEEIDGTLVVIQDPPFDVRLKPDGSALEKSYDGGATWSSWATIGPCT